MLVPKKAIGVMILGGIGVFVYGLYYYFTQQANLIKQFQYKINGVSISNFSLQNVSGTVTVLFTSVSDIEANINEFYLDFYLDGKKVGNLQDVSPFIIPARGSASIPFAYTLDPQLIFTNITDILAYTLKQKNATITLTGYAQMKSGFISGTLPITYSTSVQELLNS